MSLNTYKVTFKFDWKTATFGNVRSTRTETYIETSVSNVMNRLYSEHGALEEDLCDISLVRQNFTPRQELTRQKKIIAIMSKRIYELEERVNEDTNMV